VAAHPQNGETSQELGIGGNGDLYPPRVLLFSHRNIYEPEVWRSAIREFEGIVQAIDSVDLVAPPAMNWYKRGKTIAPRTAEYFKSRLKSGVQAVDITREYELFFTVCEKPSELLHINAVREWKAKCKTSVCWLTECYVKDIHLYRDSLELLSQFDHVIFMFAANDPFNNGSTLKVGFCPPASIPCFFVRIHRYHFDPSMY
jgi:hypothetical protein